jgi:hypothetical protein
MYAKCWSKGIHTQGLVAEDDPVCKNNTAHIHIYSSKIFVHLMGESKSLSNAFVGAELLRKDVGCQVDKKTVYF